MADASSSPIPETTTPGPPGGVRAHFARPTGGGPRRRQLAEIAPFAARYRELRPLSQGRMSTLTLSEDRLIGRTVILKRLAGERAEDPEAELRFLREATIQGQLEHPAIPPVHDLGVDPTGALYFTMKRIRGITLDEVFDGLSWDREGFRDRYPRRRLLRALATVTLAVDFAHRQGIIHRDLKPSNIMIGDISEAYVLDWGLARVDPSLAKHPADRLADSLTNGLATNLATKTADSPADNPTISPIDEALALRTLPGALLGTPGYMAPEQLGAAEEVDPTADVYALGAILFELLTGTRLHDHDRTSDKVRSMLHEAPPRPSERRPDLAIPPELDALCFAAIQQVPAARLVSARALHDGLERFLAGERDHELRAELASQHVTAAVHLREQDADPLAGRRRAIRELGRALALEPNHADAAQELFTLLAELPQETPRSVDEALDRARHRYWRLVARTSGFVYLGVLLYIPVFLWGQVESPAEVLLFFVLTTLAAALSFVVSRQERPSLSLVLTVYALSNLAFAVLAGLAGPLLVTPMIVAVNAGGFALFFGRRFRGWVFIGGALAIAAPFALELVGLLPPSYSFTDGVLIVRSRLLGAEGPPNLTLFALIALSTLATATFVFSELREMVLRRERRLLLHSWQLQQLLPRRRRDTITRC